MPHEDYTDEQRARQRAAMARLRAEDREIEIPDVLIPERKEECRKDLIAFVQHYFSQPLDEERYPGRRGLAYLELSDLHKDVLREFQKSILYGGSDALAAPRGFGKDTLAVMASLWATMYGHTNFVVFACFEYGAAKKRIEMIKGQLEMNDWLLQDFPEVCAPVRALGRSPLKGRYQTVNGEYTNVGWTTHIVLPSVAGSPASGKIIAPGSLSGSIRGMNIEGQRPSFVVITDPQTRKVAESPGLTDDVMKKIREDFGGLGSMDDPLSCLALVTIMKRGDVASQLTDPAEFPMWNGRRYKAIIDWPERMDLWDEYESLMDQGSRQGDKDGRIANDFYLLNMEEMDRGSKVAWEEAYVKKEAQDGSMIECSALQHFMNERWRMGAVGFASEFQNEPPEDPSASQLDYKEISARLSGYPNCICPPGYERVVRCIDIRGREIHFAVLASNEDGEGTFIDYGIKKVDAPEGDLNDPNSSIRPALERAILRALREVRDDSLGSFNPYKDTDGNPVGIMLNLVDSGWLGPEVVYPFCKESGPKWRPTKGDQGIPGKKRYLHPTRPSQSIMISPTCPFWHGRLQQDNTTWLFHLDADHWKLFAQERFSQTVGTAGAATIYGNDPKAHKTFAKHICAEEWRPDLNRFIERSKWNHLLDCVAGCYAAATMIGVRVVERKVERVDEVKKVMPPKPPTNTLSIKTNMPAGRKWVGGRPGIGWMKR